MGIGVTLLLAGVLLGVAQATINGRSIFNRRVSSPAANWRTVSLFHSGEHLPRLVHCGCPPGPPGPPGPKGVLGGTGYPGEPGKKGRTGKSGETGKRGRSGRKGKRGRNGERGQRGTSGRPGSPGQTGPAGPEGGPGQTGAPGLAGPQGPRGRQGPPGRPGPRGPGRRRRVPLPRWMFTSTPSPINSPARDYSIGQVFGDHGYKGYSQIYDGRQNWNNIPIDQVRMVQYRQ